MRAEAQTLEDFIPRSDPSSFKELAWKLPWLRSCWLRRR